MAYGVWRIAYCVLRIAYSPRGLLCVFTIKRDCGGKLRTYALFVERLRTSAYTWGCRSIAERPVEVPSNDCRLRIAMPDLFISKSVVVSNMVP